MGMDTGMDTGMDMSMGMEMEMGMDMSAIGCALPPRKHDAICQGGCRVRVCIAIARVV